MNNILFMSFITNSIYYIICAVLAVVVLLGIFLMSKVKTSVIGNKLSAIAMLLGIVVTLLYKDILPQWIIYPSMVIGTVIGIILALKVKMIEMPELVALLNGVGGLASGIIAIFAIYGIGATPDVFSRITSVVAIAVGFITLIGSLIAAMKLHKLISQKPIILKKHSLLVAISLILLVASIIISNIPSILPNWSVFSLVVVFSLAFGLLFTIRVGGADMPITISLLNSLSGVAAAIAGLAIKDPLLVSVGGIVGASGLLLTQIMCKAMNRHLFDILLGKTTTNSNNNFPKEEEVIEEIKEEKLPLEEVLKSSKSVIIVPGYGMAIAQAQHLVKQLADKLANNGAIIKYAIHPVAGRMPGHMNVLLCEADVDYDDLYEMDDINPLFKETDVTIVIGANDVLNPAARNAEGTPIYGMPVLSVDECKNIVIFNYDLKPGYAGVENPLYKRTNGVYLQLGNAKETIASLLEKL